VTTFRSLTLVVAILLLAGGALTGYHLLHTNTSAPLPAQLSTSDAGQPGSVPPVEQIPPAPQATPAPAQPAPTTAASKNLPATPAPAQRPTTTAPDRTSDRTPDSSGGSGRWHGTDGWHGGADGWHDPADFPRRDQYPFRPREGFGQHGPGFGSRPGQTQNGAATPSTPAAPTEADTARQQVANSVCDRYHIPREHCQIEPAGQ
jgi:hypothetical protein